MFFTPDGVSVYKCWVPRLKLQSGQEDSRKTWSSVRGIHELVNLQNLWGARVTESETVNQLAGYMTQIQPLETHCI